MFKRNHYSDLEVQEILQSLFQEKKKVKELEVQLKARGSLPVTPLPSSTHLLTEAELKIKSLEKALEAKEAVQLNAGFLEQQIVQLKEQLKRHSQEKPDPRLADLQEEEKLLKSQCELLKATLAEHEKQIDALREEKEAACELTEDLREALKIADQKTAAAEKKLREEKEYTGSLNRQNDQLKDILDRLKEEKGGSDHSLFALKEELKLQKALIEDLNVKASRLKQLETDFENLGLAHQELLSEETLLKSQCEKLKGAVSDSAKQLKELTLEKEQISLLAEQRHESHSQAQKELELLKQMMMTTLQEFKEERRRGEEEFKQKIETLEQALREKETFLTTAETKSQEKEEALQKLEEAQRILGEAFDKKETEWADLLQSWNALQKSHEESLQKISKLEEIKQNSLVELRKKEESLENLSAQASQLARALAEMEEAFENAEGERKEHEMRLRVAQQHLAKKMKESSLFAEKNEEMRLHSLELQTLVESTKTKIVELQAALEEKEHHLERLERQTQERLKSYEQNASKWEEKYLHIYEKWQISESKNRDLKRLEEQFIKLHQLLSTIPSILTLSPPTATMAIEPVAPPVDMIDISPSLQTHFFDKQATAQPASKFKDSLFD